MTPSSAPASSSTVSIHSARLELLTVWLRTHAERYGLDLATLAPASADASFRRYFRLGTGNPRSVSRDGHFDDTMVIASFTPGYELSKPTPNPAPS